MWWALGGAARDVKCKFASTECLTEECALLAWRVKEIAKLYNAKLEGDTLPLLRVQTPVPAGRIHQFSSSSLVRKHRDYIFRTFAGRKTNEVNRVSKKT